MSLQEIKVPNTQKSEAIFKIVLYLVILTVIIIAVKKVFDIFGEDKEVKKSREAAQKAYEDSANDILNTQSPTMNDAQIKLIADQIYEYLKYSALDDDKAEAELQLKRINNDADFVRLNALFGTRNEWFFGVPLGSAPFIQYVTSNLSRTRLDNINKVYQSKNISFRW